MITLNWPESQEQEGEFEHADKFVDLLATHPIVWEMFPRLDVRINVRHNTFIVFGSKMPRPWIHPDRVVRAIWDAYEWNKAE